VADDIFGTHTSLLPHGDEFGAAGVVVAGAAATAIGQLQAALGRVSPAEEAFAQGVAVCERLRSPFLLALTRCAWARSLLHNGKAEDRNRAQVFLGAGLDLARQHRFVGVKRRVDALRASFD
jgi:hypothetical protein